MAQGTLAFSERASTSFTPSLFTKTRVCRFAGQGKCNKGVDCTFAHSDRELNVVPDFTRTRMCQSILECGTCSIPRCTYAHSKDELREVVMPNVERPTGSLKQLPQQRRQRQYRPDQTLDTYFEGPDVGAHFDGLKQPVSHRHQQLPRSRERNLCGVQEPFPSYEASGHMAGIATKDDTALRTNSAGDTRAGLPVYVIVSGGFQGAERKPRPYSEPMKIHLSRLSGLSGGLCEKDDLLFQKADSAAPTSDDASTSARSSSSDSNRQVFSF